jgi:hypothetical protein
MTYYFSFIIYIYQSRYLTSAHIEQYESDLFGRSEREEAKVTLKILNIALKLNFILEILMHVFITITRGHYPRTMTLTLTLTDH